MIKLTKKNFLIATAVGAAAGTAVGMSAGSVLTIVLLNFIEVL